jgi:hypothetical protein
MDRVSDRSPTRGPTRRGALIYATARHHDARLITGDADFEGMPEVVLIR